LAEALRSCRRTRPPILGGQLASSITSAIGGQLASSITSAIELATLARLS